MSWNLIIKIKDLSKLDVQETGLRKKWSESNITLFDKIKIYVIYK